MASRRTVQRLAVILALAPAAVALAESRPEPPRMSGKHRDVFARACLECHSAERQEGGMRLDDLPLALDSVESADRWRRVLDQLNSGSMPPDDAKPLDPQDKIAVLDELSVSLAAARRLLADGGGRVPLRRLNRREYGRTIWELLGVGLDTRSLPADESAEGFDTAGGMLFMSGEQMLRYQELGREAVAAALKQAVAIRSPQKTHHEAEEKTKEILGHMRETIDLHRRNKAWMSAVDQAAAAPAVAKQAQELRSKAGDNWWEFYWHWMEFPGAPTPQSYGFKDAYDAYLEDRLWETITTQGATYLTQPAVDTGAYLGLHTNVRSCYQRALIPRHLSPGTYTIRIRLGATEAAPPDRRFLEFLASATSAADGHSHISAHHVTGTVAEPDTIEIFIRKTKESSESFEVMENRVDSGDGRRFYESEFKRNGVGPDFAIWIDWIEVEGPVVTPENEVAIRWVGGLHDRLLTIAQAEAFDTAVERPVVCEVLEAFARKACRGHEHEPRRTRRVGIAEAARRPAATGARQRARTQADRYRTLSPRTAAASSGAATVRPVPPEDRSRRLRPRELRCRGPLAGDRRPSRAARGESRDRSGRADLGRPELHHDRGSEGNRRREARALRPRLLEGPDRLCPRPAQQLRRRAACRRHGVEVGRRWLFHP